MKPTPAQSTALLAILLRQTDEAVAIAETHGKQAAYRILGLISQPADCGLLTETDARTFYKESIAAIDKVAQG